MTLMRGTLRTVLVMVMVAGGVTGAAAQSEEIEPRVIGSPGDTLIGVSGAMSRFFSTEALMAGLYTVQVDAHRFVSNRIALRAGVVGSDVFGGDPDDEVETTNTGLEAIGGALFYFTPQSIWSFYGGAEYRARVTRRLSGDPGSVTGVAGLQGALSSRASFFVEGGYGLRFRRGDEGELQTRIVGLAGVRFRF